MRLAITTPVTLATGHPKVPNQYSWSLDFQPTQLTEVRERRMFLKKSPSRQDEQKNMIQIQHNGPVIMGQSPSK